MKSLAIQYLCFFLSGLLLLFIYPDFVVFPPRGLDCDQGNFTVFKSCHLFVNALMAISLLLFPSPVDCKSWPFVKVSCQ